jgi:hypothetical protein
VGVGVLLLFEGRSRTESAVLCGHPLYKLKVGTNKRGWNDRSSFKIKRNLF